MPAFQEDGDWLSSRGRGFSTSKNQPRFRCRMGRSERKTGGREPNRLFFFCLLPQFLFEPRTGGVARRGLDLWKFRDDPKPGSVRDVNAFLSARLKTPFPPLAGQHLWKRSGSSHLPRLLPLPHLTAKRLFDLLFFKFYSFFLDPPESSAVH